MQLEEIETGERLLNRHMSGMHPGATDSLILWFLTYGTALIAAAKAAAWRPISEAPRDGKTVVAIHVSAWTSRPSIIHWDDVDGWSGITAENEKIRVKYPPTHWRPIGPLPGDQS